MKCLSTILTISLLISFASSLHAQSILKAGTQVTVKLTTDAKSKDMVTPIAKVAEDVFTQDGTLAIKRGTPVQIYHSADRARACGEPGHITLRFETTRTVNNMKVALDCNNFNREGRNKHVLSIGLGCVGFVFPPLILCLLIKGQNVTIPLGTEFTDIYTSEDVEIIK